MKKFLFNFLTIFLYALVGTILNVAIKLFPSNDYYSFFNVFISYAELIMFVGFLAYFLHKYKVNIKSITIVSIPVIIILSLISGILPIPNLQLYTYGSFFDDNDGAVIEYIDRYGNEQVTEYITEVDNFYCASNCNSSGKTFPKYKKNSWVAYAYSWKELELKGYNLLDAKCCMDKLPTSNLFNPIIIVFESVFEMIHAIFAVSLLISLYSFYKKDEVYIIDFQSHESMEYQEKNINSLLRYLLFLFIFIILYNFYYLYSYAVN